MNTQHLICFPGQGSQSLSMAQELPFELQGKFLTALEKNGCPLQSILEKNPEMIHETTNTQPIILAHSYLLFEYYKKLWKDKTITLMGHSLGELTATCLSFNLTLDESIQLARKRAQLMKEPFEKSSLKTKTVALLGQMTTQLLEKIQACENVWAINFNSPTQTVISGFKEQVDKIILFAQENKIIRRAVALDLSISSHCPLLEPALEKWKEELDKTFANKKLLFPVGSNTDGCVHFNKNTVIKNLTEQLVQPVHYHQMITQALKQNPTIEQIVELGPGKVLTGLHRRLQGNFQVISTQDLNLEKASAEI